MWHTGQGGVTRLREKLQTDKAEPQRRMDHYSSPQPEKVLGKGATQNAQGIRSG